MNTLSSETRHSWIIRPTIWLRIEGAVVLIGAITFYATRGGSWLLFALLFFAPDLSALGYLLDRRPPQSSHKLPKSENGQRLSPTLSAASQDASKNVSVAMDVSIGNQTYNLAHTLVSPALLAGYGLLAGNALAVSLALIWLAHIGLDRMVGYILKG
ncbi:MAG TPA: DUF4260 family protein [Ktedonobacteraceae bacterium]|nr:DUF4260 family protein [Ktedonobacteraceae bacterium]